MSATGLVGVIGGGTMGAGIAHAALVLGERVTLHETDAGEVAAARARVEHALRRGHDRGLLSSALEEVLERLRVEPGLSGLTAGHAIVVEAVPEVLELKRRVLREVEDLVGPDTLLGSNTSSMSIDALASALSRPERLLGLHFFNPVPASALVEVVTGTATAPAVLGRAQDWVQQLGKTAVVVHDSPGFASSRLGVALGLEAMRMLEEGVASAEDIDAAMTLGYKHPVGPLRLTDLVGLDVRLSIADHLAQELGPRFAPPQLLRDLVAQGRLGRKSGQGFYTW